MTSLEIDDIQVIILRGYGQFAASRFVLLKIEDSAKAKRWLGQIAPEIGCGLDVGPGPVLNLAISYEGLKALGLKEANLATFLPAFREGMVTPHRRRLLGDQGRSDPANWA